MDPLQALVGAPRANGAFIVRAVLAGDWSLLVRDQAPLTMMAVLSGRARVRRGTLDRFLDQGAIALVAGPTPYLVDDGAGLDPTIAIEPGGMCRRLDDSSPLVTTMSLGVRTWGNTEPDDPAATTMLIGTYERSSEVGAHLLRQLPPVTVRQDRPGGALALLAQEASHESPGQDVLLDRLLDVVVLDTVRSGLDQGSGWAAALSDPTLSPAAAAMHQSPEAAWTLNDLASLCAVSRATFARRFQHLVGQSPKAYLTDLRLALAADRLTGSEQTLDQIAREVGYTSGFALSAAFKRCRGESPKAYRSAHAG